MIEIIYRGFNKVLPFWVDPDNSTRLRFSLEEHNWLDLHAPITGLMQHHNRIIVSTVSGLAELSELWGTPRDNWTVRWLDKL